MLGNVEISTTLCVKSAESPMPHSGVDTARLVFVLKVRQSTKERLTNWLPGRFLEQIGLQRRGVDIEIVFLDSF
jgi:hypothetical protein